MAKKTYLLDTSVCLTDADAIFAYGNNDILIPLKVLEEIDNHKKRPNGVGSNARKIIRSLDNLRERGDLNKGVRLGKGKGILCVKNFDPSDLPTSFDSKIPDNQIIGTGLTELRENPKKKLIVVSRDINMRVKCDAIGIKSEDFITGQVVKSASSLYAGFVSHLVDDQLIDRFYSGESIYLEEEKVKFQPQQFIMLVSSSNERKTALARFISYSQSLKRVNEFKQGIWGVIPRNKEQAYALNLLLDPEVQVVSLVGRAGSGKTLCAIAAGLQQTLNSGQSYDRLIVSRPIQPLGKDIGYLPGTLEEKMTPWLAPIQDNLRFLMGNDKTTLDLNLKHGIIEIEALTYIRGRSIANAFIIIDEAQNLSSHELKTIVTRVGENTKIVLTGDIEQIDNVYVDETSSGLTYAVEKFKAHEIAGHITLQKGERSKVATLAAKIL
jgi:PhoH-like ATPase